MKPLLLLALALPAFAAPILTNSGSASVTCYWSNFATPAPPGAFQMTNTATGPSIDLGCGDPTNYHGPQITGSADSLTANVTQGGAYTGFSTFDFKSTQTDTLSFPGTGPAMVTFTFDLTWGAGNDITAGETAFADFWFNGAQVWTVQKPGFNFELPPFGPFTTQTIVLTEPIQLGTPFTYQADVEVTGGGNGIGYAKSQITFDSITIPEPNALSLVAVGLAGMAGRKKIARR